MEKGLREKKNDSSALRADEALLFLRSVPEVIHEKWTMEQFDTVWAQLLLYVRDGKPSGQRKLNLIRDYKGTELRSEVRSTMHSFFLGSSFSTI